MKYTLTVDGVRVPGEHQTGTESVKDLLKDLRQDSAYWLKAGSGKHIEIIWANVAVVEIDVLP